MIKKLLPILALAFCSLFSSAQTTKTVNYTLQPGACQTSVVAPRHYCMGYMTSPNAVEPMYEEEWTLYINQVQPQADGSDSFTDGFLNLFAAFDDDVIKTVEDVTNFTSTTITGTEVNGLINGSVTGTVSGKHVGTFTAALVNLKIGTVKRCAGRYGCHSAPAIVSGSIHVTAQLTQ